MLVAFGGLPGSGKTTLAKRLAQQLSAVYLRIDTIEQALVHSDVLRADIGPAGYCVAYELARDNLHLGHVVVVDSVNALKTTRDSWREVALSARARLVEVEVRCSDSDEHRRRIENRFSDVEGGPTLTWHRVQDRAYEPWPTADVAIDTAGRPILEIADELIVRIREFCSIDS